MTPRYLFDRFVDLMVEDTGKVARKPAAPNYGAAIPAAADSADTSWKVTA